MDFPGKYVFNHGIRHYTTFLLLLVNLTVPFLHLISITVDSHKKGSEAVFAGSQCRIF